MLEGTKLLLLLPASTWDIDDPPPVEHVPSVAYLQTLAKRYTKPGGSPEESPTLVTLRPGQGVLVKTGVWHCVVNLERCISINISVATSPLTFVVGATATISRVMQRAACGHDTHRIVLGDGFNKALVSCVESLRGVKMSPSLTESLCNLEHVLGECLVHAPGVMRNKSKRAIKCLMSSIRCLTTSANE